MKYRAKTKLVIILVGAAILSGCGLFKKCDCPKKFSLPLIRTEVTNHLKFVNL